MIHPSSTFVIHQVDKENNDQFVSVKALFMIQSCTALIYQNFIHRLIFDKMLIDFVLYVNVHTSLISSNFLALFHCRGWIHSTFLQLCYGMVLSSHWFIFLHLPGGRNGIGKRSTPERICLYRLLQLSGEVTLILQGQVLLAYYKVLCYYLTHFSVFIGPVVVQANRVQMRPPILKTRQWCYRQEKIVF